MERAPTAPAHITHRPLTAGLGRRPLALVTHVALSQPTAGSCCDRLPQRPKTQAGAPLCWGICCLICAAERSSNCWRRARSSWRLCPAPFTWPSPIPHALLSRACFRPACEAGEDCLGRFLRILLLPSENHASLILRKGLKDLEVFLHSQILSRSFPTEIINLLFSILNIQFLIVWNDKIPGTFQNNPPLPSGLSSV